MNVGAAAISLLGYRMRLALWGIIGLAVVCLLGLPAVFGFDIEPTRDNTWLFSAYTVIDLLFMSATDPTVAVTVEGSELGNVVEFGLAEKLLVIAVFVISTALLAALVWQVDRLFALYTKGDVFTHKSARHFGCIGWLLIILFGFELLADNLFDPILFTSEIVIVEEFNGVEAATGGVDVLGQANGERDGESSVLRFVSLDLSLLLSGLFMVMVARVMQLGVQLQQDADATI